MGKKSRSGSEMTVATILVMIGLIFSKCSGVLREILVGMKFSDLVYRDSFVLAFTIPDLVFSLLVGGSIQAAITPSLSASIAAGEEKKGWRTVNIFISVISVVLLFVCVICILFSDTIFSLYSSSNPETIRLASKASRWLFPQIFFMMLAALSIGILNAYKRFSSTAFGPTIYNIFVLLSIFLFAGNTETRLMNTTCGVMFAAVIYFLFQFIIGFDKLRSFRFCFKPRDSEFIRLLKRALPTMVSASIVYVNTVILNSFTGFFDTDGNISALKNAATTWQLPYGVFAVAVGNVMLPSLAELYSKSKYREASELLSSRLRSALFLTIPSAGFMLVMNNDVIRAIFQWNANYTDADVARAGKFLAGYSVAIVAHTVVFIMNQAFYAIGNTRIPLLAGAVGLVTNPIFCIIFISCGIGPLSLTLAYSLTSIIMLVILCVIYSREAELKPVNLTPFLLRSGLSAACMCAALAIINLFVGTGSGKLVQLMIIAVKGIIAVIVYFAMAFVLRIPEARLTAEKFAGKVIMKYKKNR